MGHVAIFDGYPHVFAGAQRCALALAGGLRERGWSAEILLPADGPFADAIRAEGIECAVLELPNALQRYGGATGSPLHAASAALAAPVAWRRVAAHVRSRADVLHVNDHRGLALAGFAGPFARVPLVWHLHSIVHSRSLTRVGARVAQRVIVPSSCVLESMAGANHLQNVSVIPNAVPTRALTAPQYGPVSPPTIVTVGRLHPDKGLDVLLHAIAHLRTAHPELRMAVYGAPQEGLAPYADELTDLAARLQLTDGVAFAGFVADPGAAVAASTLYVQPSRGRTEIQPLAVLEAMAQGVPVVATRVGDLPEMIEHDVTGLLVAPDDPAALADAIERVLADPALAQRLGAAARASVLARYPLERYVDGVLAVYDDLLTRGRAR